MLPQLLLNGFSNTSIHFLFQFVGYEHELEKVAKQDQKKLNKRNAAAAAAFHPVQGGPQYSDSYDMPDGVGGERQPLTSAPH